jgi:hypothetical protein
VRGFAALGLALVLAGCGSPGGESEPSAECINLMSSAAAAPVVADEEVQELIESLTVCETAEKWLEAVRREPGAMGLTEDADIGDLELQVACYGQEGTPVCRDAADAGRL